MSDTLPESYLSETILRNQKNLSLENSPLLFKSKSEDFKSTDIQPASILSSELKKSCQLTCLVRKGLNQEIRHRMRLIEKKKKDSLSLASCLIGSINDKLDNLHRHLNRHYDKLVSLLVKEELSLDERQIAKNILSANYIPDRDHRIKCEKIIDQAINSYRIKINKTTAIYGKTKDSIEKELGLLIEGHKNKINSIVMTSDQAYAVSGSNDGTIRLWNLKSKCQEKILAKHSMPINSIAISADNKYIISGSDDKTVKLWNLQEKTQNASFIHKESVTSVAISEDSKFIVSGCKDTLVYIWDIFSKEKNFLLAGHEDNVLTVAIKKSKTIASGSKDNSIRIWKKTDPTFSLKLLGHTSQVNCLAFTSENSYLISGSHDNSVRVWKYKNVDIHFILKGHTHPVLSVATKYNSKYLISSSIDRTIRVWNLANKRQESIFIQKGAIKSISISKDDKFLISIDNSLTIVAWDLISKSKMWSIANHTSDIIDIAINSDNSAVVSKSNNEFIVWNTLTKEQVAFINRVNANCISVSRDAAFLVFGLHNRGIYIWDIVHKSLYIETYDHNDIVNCISIASDSSFVVTGSSDTQIILTNLHEPTCFTFFTGHTDKILCIGISIDNQLIASGSADKSVIVWNIYLNKQQAVFKDHKDSVTSVAITSDTRYVVSGSDDGSLRIWNLIDMVIENVINDIESPINCLCLDYQDNLIVLGLKDNNVIIINRNNIAKWFKCPVVNNFKGHLKEIIGVGICQDSKQVVSCSKDGIIKKWDLGTSNNVSTFSMCEDYKNVIVFDTYFSNAYIATPFGEVMIFGVKENKVLSFEKLFDKNLVHDVLIIYPAMKEFIRKQLHSKRGN
jgi:WD40 repeat protein